MNTVASAADKSSRTAIAVATNEWSCPPPRPSNHARAMTTGTHKTCISHVWQTSAKSSIWTIAAISHINIATTESSGKVVKAIIIKTWDNKCKKEVNH